MSKDDVTAAAHGASPIAFGDVGKHTPTPWHVHDCEPYQETKVFKDGRTVVGGEDGDQAVAYCDYITPRIARANAALIVKAVNSHGALVSALLKCRHRFAEYAASHTMKGSDVKSQRNHAMVDMIDDALSSLHREAIADAPASAEGVKS
jgi:hypothetical protein